MSPSPIAGTSRTRLGWGCALAISLLAPRAAADDARQACTDAYTATQVLRDEGKLDEGMRSAEVCAREVCAQFMRDDCIRWKGELEARVATIIVEVLDASGAALTDVEVTLDGRPWLDRLDGVPHAVAKGKRELEVTPKGAPMQKKSIVVVEGEKNRRITLSLAPLVPSGEARNGVHDVAPWIIGGVGLGALIAGAITGGLVVDAYGVTQDECDDATETCSPEGVSAQSRGRVLGPVTTTLLVGGGVLVAAGVVWLLVAPDEAEPASTSLFVAPSLSPSDQGVVVGGTF